MNRLSLLLLLAGSLLVLPNQLQAQCPSGELRLTTQQEVEDFAANYPNCTSITGNLIITGASATTNFQNPPSSLLPSSDISDLTPLAGIQTVAGNLVIFGNQLLPDLNGLENISTVGGTLYLTYNAPILQNIDGLSGLTSLGNNLEVKGNDGLSHIDALSGISSLGFRIVIAANENLTNLDGLSGITNVNGLVSIGANPSLLNLDGLSNLDSIHVFLLINRNERLTNLNGLSNLDWVGSNLNIINNYNLTEYCGLYPLLSAPNGLVGNFDVRDNGLSPTPTEIIAEGACSPVCIGDVLLSNQAEVDAFDCSSITGNLTISGSDIDDLTSLEKLRSIGGNLSIQSNPSLSEFCVLYSLLNTNGLTGTFTTAGNAANPTDTDILNTGPCAPDCTGDILLSSQAEVDAFNCTTVDGGLVIAGGDITDLSALSNLTSIGEDLILGDNDLLTNVDPLTSLATIGGSFLLDRNDALNNLDGLSSLQSVGGEITFVDNGALADVDGLSALTTVGGNLRILGNDFLGNVDGLSSLSSVGGDLEIAGQDVLLNVDGLSALTFVGGQIFFQSNDLLENINGLSSVVSVGSGVWFALHPVLTEYCGLYPLFTNPGGLGGSVLILLNGFNPDSAAIVAAGPCAPPAILDDDLTEDPVLLVSSGTSVLISGSFSEGVGAHTITIDWGDEDASNPFTTATVDEVNHTYNSSYSYTQTGIYLVTITITDASGNSSSYTAENNVLIYNPMCGSARMAATYNDPTDGLYYHVLTRARYNGQGQIHHRSGFRFYRWGQGGQNWFYFKSLVVDAMVISGNTATITGQGRYFSQGSGWSNTPTHSFSVSFQDVAHHGQSDQIQSLTITELATGNVVYTLASPVNVWCSRVRVNNTANCRVGEPIDELAPQPQMNDIHVFPNPFQSVAQIPYQLTEESHVRLTIHDMQGRVIRMEEENRQAAGTYSYKWNATNQQGREVAAGVYLVRLQINQQTFVKQVVYRPI
ncbi:MAG: FlgD immunoglobulin-like domain containing protein [Bacteroidota bacterium]